MDMDTEKPKKKNPWWEFVKQNRGNIKANNNKELFNELSYMWKNEKSKMITIHSQEIVDMHTNMQNMKKLIEEQKLCIESLQERISYFETL